MGLNPSGESPGLPTAMIAVELTSDQSGTQPRGMGQLSLLSIQLGEGSSCGAGGWCWAELAAPLVPP